MADVFSKKIVIAQFAKEFLDFKNRSLCFRVRGNFLQTKLRTKFNFFLQKNFIKLYVPK